MDEDRLRVLNQALKSAIERGFSCAELKKRMEQFKPEHPIKISRAQARMLEAMESKSPWPTGCNDRRIGKTFVIALFCLRKALQQAADDASKVRVACRDHYPSVAARDNMRHMIAQVARRAGFRPNHINLTFDSQNLGVVVLTLNKPSIEEAAAWQKAADTLFCLEVSDEVRIT